jgi:hypothetical protein
MKTLSQQYIAYRIISYPIRVFLRSQCDDKRKQISEIEKSIELGILKSRGCGRTETNFNVIMWNIFQKSKLEKFLYYWG